MKTTNQAFDYGFIFFTIFFIVFGRLFWDEDILSFARVSHLYGLAQNKQTSRANRFGIL